MTNFDILTDEMSRTFNCGIGMVVVVERDAVAQVKEILEAANEQVFEIGQVVTKAELNGEEVQVRNADTW